MTLERREDFVDLAVEAREVSLGRREVVRVEKPIPIDSDFSPDGIPAVRDHAQLLFIPVDIPDLDESCRGRIERALAGIRIPEEATDRDIKAGECLVSGDVVRTVHESGGAAHGDVHLFGEVLAQRDRASWKRKTACGNCNPVEKRWRTVGLDSDDLGVRPSSGGSRFHFGELGVTPRRDADDAGDRLDGFSDLGRIAGACLELDIGRVVREDSIQSRPRGRIDRDECSCDERDREEHTKDRGQCPSPTAKDVCRGVAEQGHGIPPASPAEMTEAL